MQDRKLSYVDLLALAAREAYVHWLKSGIVERLSLCPNGKRVVARVLGQPRAHAIRDTHPAYDCREVAGAEKDALKKAMLERKK